MWYFTGSPLCINPITALQNGDSFPGFVPHGPNFAFNLAQSVETMAPSFTDIAPRVRAFCAAPRRYPHEIQATTDSGQAGLFGGVKEIQCRAWHQPLYALS